MIVQRGMKSSVNGQAVGNQREIIRGVVPLRHLRHVPPPPDSIVTVVNSFQNLISSITLCITLNATIGKIVFVTPDFRQSGTIVKYVTTQQPSLPV